MVRLLELEADGLDHPLSLANISFRTTKNARSKAPEDQPHTFKLVFSRDLSSSDNSEGPSSKLHVQLTNLSLISRSKAKISADGLAQILADAQSLVSRLSSVFVLDASLANKTARMLPHLAQTQEGGPAKLSFRGQAEFGDCDISVFDFGGASQKPETYPILTLKLSNFDKIDNDLMINDRKNQLSQAKLHLISSREIQDEMDNVITDLQSEVVRSSSVQKQMEKRIQELEKQLIQTKMELAEAKALI
eukprot:TRINITY_DN3732_c0_g2_i1.p1 TRINITY_DN3732_c0_g2~~TRINITY_DN3732_c0_g2_i1.p1  ORF type:complete len:248 (+),score=107.40 TRINITY_DN3732_c0_g2_i1:334-1077(+)